MIDIFISYSHESKSIADNICATLEQKKIRCWYAPRDIIGDYATSIVEAINQCKVFILILNENSSNSQHCLNEIEIAYKANIEFNKGIVIMPFKIDNRNLSMAMEYYIKRLHWIDGVNKSLDEAIFELYEKIVTIIRPSGSSKQREDERRENKYFFAEDIKEKNRLNIQQKLLKSFDQEVYDQTVAGKSGLSVLDVGCNDGSLILDRLGDKQEVDRIIGLEYDEESVIETNLKNKNLKFKIYQCDIESDEFQDELTRITQENNLKTFDIINISMVILHLKKPYKLIKILRKFLNNNGRMIIKDIDDGLNFAYPDDGTFKRVYEICQNNETSGFRKSGRQIYSYLSKNGFSKIKLIKSGLSTIGLNYEERQALFDTYFSFILDDLKIMHQRYPEDSKIQENLTWYADNYDEIEEKFHDESFMFNLGFMLFSAEK